jgi:hypothetical protein
MGVVMNERETFGLLTIASARDGRKVSESVAKVWAEDLADIPIGIAEAAVRLHFQESDVWLKPFHVIANAKRVREGLLREDRKREPVIERGPITLDRVKFEAETQAALLASRAAKAVQL